jgi:hypothetical protein
MNASIEELIRFLTEVAKRHKLQAITNQAMITKGGSNKQGLQSRIGQCPREASVQKCCSNCKHIGHIKNNCWFLKPKCDKCRLYGHEEKDCRSQVDICITNNMHRNKHENQNNRNTLGSKRVHTSTSVSTNAAVEQAHIVEVLQVTGQAFDAKAECTDSDNDFQVDSYDINDDAVSYYDWLADSCTTSHICNKHETFIEYCASNAKV